MTTKYFGNFGKKNILKCKLEKIGQNFKKLANLSRPQICHNLESDTGKTKQRDIKTTQKFTK
jgi:hypothetical protein